ncbi:MAG: magnesium transporter, partial [Pseudomonadales bacterium]|nr:magnesium transporter [Pseudomonadales bacterium]
HRQHEAELYRKLKQLNAADTAHLLEMVPHDVRLLVWNMLAESSAAAVVLELNPAACEDVLEHTTQGRLLSLLALMDTDDWPEIASYISADVLQQAKAQLEAEERQWLETTLSYPEDTVGTLMSNDAVLIDPESPLDQVINDFRDLDSIPDQVDKLFVVKHHHLVGLLPITALLRHPGNEQVKNVMQQSPVTFSPMEDADSAAYAFDRYDLISAPVIDEKRRVVGRLTVESVMDYVRERNEEATLAKGGLTGKADLFSSVWESAQTRWLWLCINLITAFIATRFIALFEDAIAALVALATLMPIIASVGGNTGNQTVALFIRSLALDQINRNNLRYLIGKELSISILNGMLWGSVLGTVALLLYGQLGLALVMASATLMNLVIAALTGIAVPVMLDKMGRDPAMGASVILTFVTDSMGFLIFLGLASWWLV